MINMGAQEETWKAASFILRNHSLTSQSGFHLGTLPFLGRSPSLLEELLLLLLVEGESREAGSCPNDFLSSADNEQLP